MKRLLFVLWFCLSLAFTSVSQHFGLLEQFGSSGEDVGYSITEGDNSFYVAGWFQNTVTFGDFNLTSIGDDDIFILRMSYSGEVLWAMRIGGFYEDNVVGLVADNNGNIYISGICSENADFGSIILPGFGGADAFICRIHKDGEVIWAVSGGGFYNDRAYRLSLSPQGDFLAFAGQYTDLAQFGTFTLPSLGGRDGFISRIDTSGFFSWVFYFGNYSDESGYGVDIDTDGSVYCAGYFFSDTLQIGSATLINSSENADCILIKLNSGGAVSFAKSFGGSQEDLPRPLYIEQESIYIGGYHSGSGNYLGIPVSGNSQYRNSFVLKCDMSGDGLWVLDGLSQNNDELIGMGLSDDNHVVISGGFEGTFEIGIHPFTSNGLYDAYLVNVDASTGIPLAAMTAGGPGNDIFFGTTTFSDKVLVAGFFENTAQFDSISLFSAGLKDIVIASIEDIGIGFLEQPKAKLTIYPNPCQNQFTITFADPIEIPRLIAIRTVTGQLVKTIERAFGEQCTIDVSGCKPGLYLIEVADGVHMPYMGKIQIIKQ